MISREAVTLCSIFLFTFICLCLNYSGENQKTFEKESGQDKYANRSHYSESPNGRTSIEIVRENGKLNDSVLINGKEDDETLIALENIFYTDVENTCWLDNTRYSICGHVNPSLSVYILFDTEKPQIIDKYYGIGFTWNKNRDKLYYILTAPHFSESISCKIIDNEGHIYFETRNGESILDKLAFSDDEQFFIFYTGNTGDEPKLVITKMNENKRLIKHSVIDAQFGDIKIHGNQSITITRPDGSIYYYNWP